MRHYPNSFSTTSLNSLVNADKSTFVSPASILDKTLPNSRNSAGTLESAAISCADLKFPLRFGTLLAQIILSFK